MDWLKLRERILTLPALEQKRAHLKDQIEQAETELDEAQRLHEHGRKRVDRMQRESFSAFLLRLIDRYDDKLEKVQQDEIHAKLEYDRAVKHLDFLNSELAVLKTRIADISKDERTYQAELQKRRGKSTGFEDKIAELVSQLTEIREALSIADRAESTAERALASLESAETWATIDVLTSGGFLTHMAKYSHIDEAEDVMHELSSLLRDLQVELGDVHGMEVGNLGGIQEISSTQRSIDLWFDNIFTDWSVKEKIANNSEEIRFLLRNIAQIKKALDARLRELSGELSAAERAEEEMLMA